MSGQGHKRALSDVRFTPKSGHWNSVGKRPQNREGIAMLEAAEIAALLGFGSVRTWPSGTSLALCCADGQPPLRYSGLVQNRHHFLRADDTNGRWDSLANSSESR